ncbi:hypothetical protein [Streptomyces sp. NPDC058295]|uniref:hypothetical protein n=1 Tax=Streptomyces sp. NPDC058295 TaxID=3346431 RepID=UPI0036E0AD99
MSSFSDWQDRMLRSVWRHGDNLPDEVLEWMAELYNESGEVTQEAFCDLWTARTFSMARAAFEVIRRSVESEMEKAITGEDFCYIDYLRDQDFGPVGRVRIKSAEVSTPDRQEVLSAMAEGVQEFVMGHYGVVWPVCDRHGFGLHVDFLHDTAVWHCAGESSDGHTVRAVDPAVPLQSTAPAGPEGAQVP